MEGAAGRVRGGGAGGGDVMHGAGGWREGWGDGHACSEEGRKQEDVFIVQVGGCCRSVWSGGSQLQEGEEPNMDRLVDTVAWVRHIRCGMFALLAQRHTVTSAVISTKDVVPVGLPCSRWTWGSWPRLRLAMTTAAWAPGGTWSRWWWWRRPAGGAGCSPATGGVV